MYRRMAFLAVVVGTMLVPTTASAANPQVTTFNFTGGEQTYTVPPGMNSVAIIATGGAGGGPSAGRGAVVSALVPVTPGEVLYVEVGGIGGQPLGGFNGGGNGPSASLVNWFGGGGASDVRTLPRSDSGSLESRVIVAGGGGGAPGGDAGQPGGAAGGGAGTQTSGGLGGCPPSGIGCGTDGTLGQGGDGGTSGGGIDVRLAGGGGGGLYGGGGGGADLTLVGGGGGGSSLLPAGGGLTLATLTTPPTVIFASRLPPPKPTPPNKPADPSCVGTQLTSYIGTYGSVKAAAAAFGLTVPEGIQFIFNTCSNGSH